MSDKNKDEIIKMLLDKIWDIVSDGDEIWQSVAYYLDVDNNQFVEYYQNMLIKCG